MGGGLRKTEGGLPGKFLSHFVELTFEATQPYFVQAMERDPNMNVLITAD